MPTITEQVQQYIARHPYVKDCLSQELINYSSLARTIAHSLQLPVNKHFDAIVAAARRHTRDLVKQQSNVPQIQSILAQSRVELKNKMYVGVIKPSHSQKTLHTIQQQIKDAGDSLQIVNSQSGTTIITSMHHVKVLQKHIKSSLLQQHQNVVQITITSPQKIESVSGVMSHVYSLLGENNVNIIETFSCWTDTIVLVEEHDVTKAMSLLQF